ncbi:hypothetical protein ACFSBJ_06285 [Haloplanus ruber]|uniref:Uncharacterized protein n=1 Tax=Haloplanus ruber TaxID=869892 RepID=A0ABD6CVT3_9EURY
MGRGTRRRVVATGVIVLLVISGMASTVAAAPTLDVRVDGASVDDGATVTVTDDPRLRVEASGESAVASIAVEVDGETRHSFQPDAESVSEQVTLDIDDGEHEVRVVAEGSGTTEWTATIRKDSDGPRVSYTSPFTTERGRPSEAVVLDHADTTLAADLADESGVQLVRIERDYEWTFGGRSRRDRQTYRISDPGDNFSRPMLFGLGENDLTVETRDVHGQRTTHDITIRVEDISQPSIDLDRFERNGNTLEIAGVVEDEVKVRSLDVRVDRDRKSVVTETSREPTRERLSVAFEDRVRLTGDVQEVTFVATDVAGNTREWTVPLDYRGHIVPTIDIDDEATRVDGDADAVEGTVTDGQVRRVVVETLDADGNTVSTATAYDGEVTERVDVRARLGRAEGETTVVVRAVDVDGQEHERTLTLDAGGTPTATSAPSTTAATSTPAASTPATTATTAAADVDRATATASSGAGVDWLVPLSSPLSIVVAILVLGLALVIGLVTNARSGSGGHAAATDSDDGARGRTDEDPSADRPDDVASAVGGESDPVSRHPSGEDERESPPVDDGVTNTDRGGPDVDGPAEGAEPPEVDEDMPPNGDVETGADSDGPDVDSLGDGTEPPEVDEDVAPEDGVETDTAPDGTDADDPAEGPGTAEGDEDGTSEDGVETDPDSDGTDADSPADEAGTTEVDGEMTPEDGGETGTDPDGTDADTRIDDDSAPAFDVTDHLGVASIDEVGTAEVSTLTAELGRDDPDAVVDAVRGLAAIAGERPELIAGTEVEFRLRDLRLEPDRAVSDAADAAIRRLSEAREE